jgi:RNA polymerase sigma-70 factor, ECF subfamily
MAWPSRIEELELHERILAKDPVGPVDLFKAFADPLESLIHYHTHCSDDEAHDSVIDALLFYMEHPEAYDREVGRLSTYLGDIAKKRAIDRIRSSAASRRRNEKFGAIVELGLPNPKDELELTVQAREIEGIVLDHVQNNRDRMALKLMLEGERSTSVLAEALGLQHLSARSQREEVKRHKDRLMKILQRLNKRLSHENA